MNKNTVRIAGLTVLLLIFFGSTLYWMASSGPARHRKLERNLTQLPQNQLRRTPLERDTIRVEVEQNLAADSLRITSEALLKASPEVLDSVKIHLEQKFLEEADGTITEIESSLRALMVNMFTRAHVWMRMTSSAKVDLLYATFKLVMERHPHVEPIVTLIFDDGRQDLSFSFHDVQLLLGARSRPTNETDSRLTDVRPAADPAEQPPASTTALKPLPTG